RDPPRTALRPVIPRPPLASEPPPSQAKVRGARGGCAKGTGQSPRAKRRRDAKPAPLALFIATLASESMGLNPVEWDFELCRIESVLRYFAAARIETLRDFSQLFQRCYSAYYHSDCPLRVRQSPAIIVKW